MADNFYARYPVTGGGVSSINTLTGAITLAAGTNISLGTVGNTITINNTQVDTGITQLTGDVTAGPGSGSQVATIANNAVTGPKFRLANNQYLRARNAANSADVNLLYYNPGNFFILEDGNGLISIGVTERLLVDENGAGAISYATALRQLQFPTASDSAVDWTTEAIVKVGGDLQMHTSPQTTVAPIFSLSNDADTQSVRMKAPAALAATYTLTLPPDDGSASQVLTTDGSGVLSWSTPVTSATSIKETFVLSGTNITNQYIDLANVAANGSILFMVQGSGSLLEGASYDYSVSYTGGAGSKTRITFLNDLATGGGAALIATDVVQVNYAT